MVSHVEKDTYQRTAGWGYSSHGLINMCLIKVSWTWLLWFESNSIREGKIKLEVRPQRHVLCKKLKCGWKRKKPLNVSGKMKIGS